MWKELEQDKKQKYLDLAKERKEKYLEEMEVFKKTRGASGEDKTATASSRTSKRASTHAAADSRSTSISSSNNSNSSSRVHAQAISAGNGSNDEIAVPGATRRFTNPCSGTLFLFPLCTTEVCDSFGSHVANI